MLAGIWNSVTLFDRATDGGPVFPYTEKMTRRRVLGLGRGFVGAATILGCGGAGGSSLAGQLMCLTAACYGVAIPYTRRLITPRPESGLAGIGRPAAGRYGDLAGAGPAGRRRLSGRDRALGVRPGFDRRVGRALGTGLVFVLHMRNIRLLGASTASMVTYLIPVVATAIGVLVLGEDLAWFSRSGLRSCSSVWRSLSAAADSSRSRHPVKETELWQRLEATLGSRYYRVWASEFGSWPSWATAPSGRLWLTAYRARPSGGRSGQLSSCRRGSLRARPTET